MPSAAPAIIEEAKARATDEGNKIVAAARARSRAAVEPCRPVKPARAKWPRLAVKGAEQILRKEVNAGVHAILLNRLKTEL